ncbi:hypothetical protein GE21DRAFT_6549 [Neurospora crassa]|uniref:SAP domain-containing protein n=1 Tax=Neurospora crassa (strain ATCC 24698 / 74-OR23-1A / CBS 708.71 / DSM 1257 / FGSC 987) TaxID=367110 RepID=Q7S8X6_NEUCR|nr:hypothetical protein NCU08839 [Neurospora crassa OR74A]EAA32814.2 hypothetical protein NCU08839 [Neurospora crassa OR74A]KHE79772.1 hypothetical protein GE21DRAFT_6549 [Neurospora crassa]|eukprot:XP_962050.2 hypothetical protein NCU08839 [Neurospora crassa OR74A]
MNRLTADWLPDDTPWEKLTWFTKDELRKQCAKRSLPVTGTKSVLQQRLLDYQRTHTTEVRPCPLRLEFPCPLETEYGRSAKPTRAIVLVEDLSTFRACLKMRFTFASHQVTHLDGDIETFAKVQVNFTNKPSCSCRRHFLHDLPCYHVEYLLRKFFNCPEPLLWQEAYLTSELEYIYRKSHAALSRVKPDRYRQGKRCVICFDVHKTHEKNVPCSLCGMPTHSFCLKALRKKRKFDPAQASQCILCLDKTALAVEKYFGRSQVSPAVAGPGPALVPNAPASNKALAGPDRSVTSTTQSEAVSPDSIERTTTMQEPHSAAQQKCTSTPLPGVPALIWQEMHQQAREQRQQQQQQQQQKQSEQRQRQDEQKQKQQRQQQQSQAKVRAIRPVITEVRVSELPDPARVEVGSRVAAKQTPITQKLVSKEIGGSPAAAAAAAAAASGSGVRSPIQSSPPPISTATQPDKSAVNPCGDSRGRSTEATEVAGLANEQANNADVPGSILIGANTIITATLDDDISNNSNNADRKAAKLARNLKRLEVKLEQLDRDADYYYKKAERRSQKYQTVQKKIRKIKEKAEKRALARRREGVEEGAVSDVV